MNKHKAIVLLISFIFFVFISPLASYAQVGQVWETIVGIPANREGEDYDDGIGGDSGRVGEDGLKPGEFRPPFKCGNTYVSTTYPGGTHNYYSVDFNSSTGEDRGHPVRAAADGQVILKTIRCGQIILRHDGGYKSVYVHMRNITVDYHDQVKVGQKIGEISDVATNLPNDCRAIGAHLHTSHMKGVTPIKLAYMNNKGEIEPNPWSQYFPKGEYYRKPPLIFGQCP